MDKNKEPTPGTSNASDTAPVIADLVKLVTTLTNKVEFLADKVQDSADSAVLKKYEPKKVYKKKGNKIQHSLNECVFDTLDIAVKYNEAGKTERANNLMKSTMKKMTVRNKHIDIAEQSEFGFLAVDFYEQPDVADDDSDQKRIVRADARARAERKRSADSDFDTYKHKRGRGAYRGNARSTFSGYTHAPPVPPYNPYAPPPYALPPPMFAPPMQVPYMQQPFPSAPGFNQWGNSGSSAFNQPRQSNGRCYTCQQFGHFARNCPQKSQAAQSGSIPYKR